MRVFIAEKPSLAKAIFEGLGGNSSAKMQNGYFQIGDNKITSCFGHMLELFDPQDYDEKYQKWHLDDLPIKSVYPPKLKPKPESQARLNVIFDLIKEADEIIHAGDVDAEGQKIVDDILLFVENTKPVKRILIADLNLKPVQKALDNLKPNSEFHTLGQSATARSIGDQLFGFNLTRLFTLQGRKQGYDGVLNVGRVQSAVMGLINSRTLANQSHESSFYYDISGKLSTNQGAFTARYQPTEDDIIDEKNRIIDANCANNIKAQCEQASAHVIDVATKAEKKAAPLPYNLSNLQQTCAKKWGYSADTTLDIMQSLYETHKLLTYPRADCRYLSDEHYDQRETILNAIKETLPSHEDAIEQADTEAKHKAFNTDKITAHHAICPTEKSGANCNLTQQEKNIYTLVATSYIALFYPESVRDKTKVNIQSGEDRRFTATQSVLCNLGWESLFKGEPDNDSEKALTELDLTLLKQGQQLNTDSIDIAKKETKPPKYFVESTLLAAMTKAAKFIKDPVLRKTLEEKDKDNIAESGSIGTEATRASILTKIAENTELVTVSTEKGYKEKVWKTTIQGQDLCAVLPKEVCAPDISAIWSGKQAAIVNGELSVEEFVHDLDIYLDERITDVKTTGITITPNMSSCPQCKKGLLGKRKGENGLFWGCSNHPECKTAYPDKGGKPNLNVKPKRPLTVSNHKCPECEKGLVRRKAKAAKGKVRYYWTCSGYPECETSIFDKAGKPNFATARTVVRAGTTN